MSGFHGGEETTRGAPRAGEGINCALGRRALISVAHGDRLADDLIQGSKPPPRGLNAPPKDRQLIFSRMESSPGDNERVRPPEVEITSLESQLSASDPQAFPFIGDLRSLEES